MQEGEDESSSGLSILDEFFMSIPPFSPNVSILNSTVQENLSVDVDAAEAELESDVAAVVEDMIATVENNNKTPSQTSSCSNPDFEMPSDFERQLTGTEFSVVESIFKTNDDPVEAPPKGLLCNDPDVLSNNSEPQLMGTDDGFNNASVQILHDTPLNNNVPHAALKLINYIKTRKSFSKPDKDRVSTTPSTECIMEEINDVTTPDVIIDSILFLGGHKDNNDNHFEFRMIPIKTEPSAFNKTISKPAEAIKYRTSTEHTTNATETIGVILPEKETLQNVEKISLPFSTASKHTEDTEFFKKLSIQIKALEAELKIGSERCEKVQKVLLEQSRLNDGNLQMLKTIKTCLSSLKLSIIEKEHGMKVQACKVASVRSESTSECSVITITDNDGDSSVSHSSSADQDVSDSSKMGSVSRSTRIESTRCNITKPTAGAALRRKNVINEVKRSAKVYEPKSMHLRKRQATVTSEDMTCGTVRKRVFISPTRKNVKPMIHTENALATDGEVRAWYWSPQQPTRAEIRKTTSAPNNPAPSPVTTSVNASKVNCTFKTLDLFNKCPYCWAKDHSADDCNVYPLVEQRARACDVMMLCPKCVAIHPKSTCLDERNWRCVYCGERNHDSSLCTSEFHRNKCCRINDQVLKKGLVPSEQFVKITWHEFP